MLHAAAMIDHDKLVSVTVRRRFVGRANVNLASAGHNAWGALSTKTNPDIWSTTDLCDRQCDPAGLLSATGGLSFKV